MHEAFDFCSNAWAEEGTRVADGGVNAPYRCRMYWSIFDFYQGSFEEPVVGSYDVSPQVLE